MNTNRKECGHLVHNGWILSLSTRSREKSTCCLLFWIAFLYILHISDKSVLIFTSSLNNEFSFFLSNLISFICTYYCTDQDLRCNVDFKGNVLNDSAPSTIFVVYFCKYPLQRYGRFFLLIKKCYYESPLDVFEWHFCIYQDFPLLIY